MPEEQLLAESALTTEKADKLYASLKGLEGADLTRALKSLGLLRQHARDCQQFAEPL
jgi:hypothetical protein